MRPGNYNHFMDLFAFINASKLHFHYLNLLVDSCSESDDYSRISISESPKSKSHFLFHLSLAENRAKGANGGAIFSEFFHKMQTEDE